MALSVGETYIGNKKVGRIFPQGIEAKEIWFQGNRIFKSGGLEKRKMPTANGDQAIEMNGYIVVYSFILSNPSKYTIGRLKDGVFVDQVEICTTPTGYYGVNYFAVANHKYKVLIISEELHPSYSGGYVRGRTFFYDGINVREFNITEEHSPYFGTSLALYQSVYQPGGLFYGYEFFKDGSYHYGTGLPITSEEALHYKHFIRTIFTDSHGMPIASHVDVGYGIDMDIEIENDKYYEFNYPLIESCVYDQKNNWYLGYLLFGTQYNRRNAARYVMRCYCTYAFDGTRPYVIKQHQEPYLEYVRNTTGLSGGANVADRLIGDFNDGSNQNYIMSRYYNDLYYPVLIRSVEDMYVSSQIGDNDMMNRSFVTVPSFKIAYSEKTKTYYSLFVGRKSYNYVGLEGFTISKNPNDPSKMFYEMDLEDKWEHIDDIEYDYSSSGNASACNDDGAYFINGAYYYYYEFENEESED